MKAIVYQNFGSPDILRFEEIDKPTPADNEVLMRVPFERCATSRSWCTKKCDSQGLRPAPQREPIQSRCQARKSLPASLFPVLIRSVRIWIVGNPYLIALRQSCP
jgi:hypothetical protein